MVGLAGFPVPCVVRKRTMTSYNRAGGSPICPNSDYRGDIGGEASHFRFPWPIPWNGYSSVLEERERSVG